MFIKKILTKNSLFLFSVSALILFVCLVFLPACSKEKKEQSVKIAVPVTVESVIQKAVPVQIHAIGNVEAYSSVSIKSRVSGELTRVYSREGQDVNKGDMLFTIDSAPFKTALESAQANLAKDTALAKKAEEDVRRYTELYRDELVSRSQYEQIFSTAEALKATVEGDKAAVENARLQLNYCSISAPISGRTGSLLVNEGNLIKANDDKPMLVINQMQPIYVSFSVPEKNLPEIKRYMAREKLKVEAFISNEDTNPAEGLLTFIDNTVDAATGTIKLKATFSNNDKKLWPGQFVNVIMTLSTQPGAIVVPSQAVQTGQQGQYIFVVKDDLTVEQRPVEVDRTINDEAVIAAGLKGDEQVVTDGQLRLVPGAKVEIKK